MATIKNENFYVIQGWMLTKLGLTGNHLIIYAILWSFSQDGVSEFRGTIDYIAEFSGAGRATVVRVLSALEERGLIEKEVYNDRTGKTNGYKCVPYELLKIDDQEEEPEEVVNKSPERSESVSQNEQGGCIKMRHPVYQNEMGVYQNETPPLHNKKENINIYTSNKKESKKESCIYTNTHERGCEKEDSNKLDKPSYLPEFETMSDEELIDFGENTEIDFEHYYEILEAYENELMLRKQNASRKWRKKVIRTAGKFEYLKSHEDILREWNVNGAYAEALRKYLIHSYARHRLVTNVQLEEILSQLDDKYAFDEKGKIDCIEFSLQRGYTSIIIGGEGK